MPKTEKPEIQPLEGSTKRVTVWADARGQFVAADYYWLATIHPAGRPHIRPVLAVWIADALYFCSGATTQKTGNLTSVPHCSLATETDDFHFVLEGKAAKRGDMTTLQDVADVYASKYGWEVDVSDGAFHATGAPTAGEPPYEVYEVNPETIFGFGLNDSTPSTRWQFAEGN